MNDSSASSITTLPQTPAAPVIQNRRQLEVLLENIAQLQRERDELHQQLEDELAAVRLKYRPPLDEMESFLDKERSWAENWARANPGQFGADHVLACSSAIIGFEPAPVRIERASRRWTWSRIALTLAGLPWGKTYLRIPPPEVDKDALLADLAILSPEDLRTAGMKIIQAERFFIEPRSAEPLQEAA